MPITKWERVPPAEPCVSPDGHEHTDVMTFGSLVPKAVVCGRCGKPWTVLVFGDDKPKET